MNPNIPEIAVMGHPNEGKSSVLSTLAEDDSVRISPYPGETTVCRTFPVIVDNREILRFTDTPGFQNPGRLLAKFRTFTGSSENRLQELVAYTGANADLEEDNELLAPVARGAGIIYVVNSARPIRNVDRDEMELLRLIGKPRMAVINSKATDSLHIDQWKDELAKHFNSIRLFDAHHAGYHERISLLEALKAIDQDWQHIFDSVIDIVEKDWQNRINAGAHIITSFLSDSISLTISGDVGRGKTEQYVRDELVGRYTEKIVALEQRTHGRIRGLFKHNRFDFPLPPHSILHDDIFSEKSWQLFGLTRNQLIVVGGLSGGAIGAGIDVAALGHGLGIFTALGAAGGAIGALTGRKHLDYESSLLGMKISGPQLTIGPAGSISLLFVLINRSLHYFRHISDWSHGRRDYPQHNEAAAENGITSYTSEWTASQLKTCHNFFRSAPDPESEKHREAAVALETLLTGALRDLVTSR